MIHKRPLWTIALRRTYRKALLQTICPDLHNASFFDLAAP